MTHRQCNARGKLNGDARPSSAWRRSAPCHSARRSRSRREQDRRNRKEPGCGWRPNSWKPAGVAEASEGADPMSSSSCSRARRFVPRRAFRKAFRAIAPRCSRPTRRRSLNTRWLLAEEPVEQPIALLAESSSQRMTDSLGSCKSRPLASRETPWRHSTIAHRCDTKRHCRSGDHKRGLRRAS